MKMNISSEHRFLIETVIRDNPKFEGSEDLLDLFIDATYKKSYLVIDAIRDTKRLKKHLALICDSCIDQIIKEKQKYQTTNSIKKSSNDVVSVRKTPFIENQTRSVPSSEVVILKEEIQKSEKYDSVDSLIDPLDFCPKKRVSENTIDKLVQIVKSIEAQFPNKRFFEIFLYRYIKQYNQTDTAREMKISQVELSKRFVEMIKLIREQI